MALEVSILTLNCWGIPFFSKDRDLRINAIADELATGKYNLVALQEVWSTDDFNIIAERTKAVLPYNHYFYSGVAGSGICILSAFAILETFFHAWPLNGYIHRIQHADWFGGKGVGLCKLKTNDGQIIHFYSAHLVAEYDRVCDDYMAHRLLQALDTSKFISLTSTNADLSILAGDLNTEPGDLPHRLLLESTEYMDSFLDNNKGNGRNDKLKGTNEDKRNTYTPLKTAKLAPGGKRIDYILYKGTPKKTVTVTSYSHPLADTVPGHAFSYSDHEAVVATLKIANLNTFKDDPETNELYFVRKRRYIETLKESIKTCDTAYEKLYEHRRSYFIWAITSLVLLFSVFKMSDSVFSFVSGFMLLLQIFLTFLVAFGFLMATIWNLMERNSLYAGKLSMELQLNAILNEPRKV